MNSLPQTKYFKNESLQWFNIKENDFYPVCLESSSNFSKVIESSQLLDQSQVIVIGALGQCKLIQSKVDCKRGSSRGSYSWDGTLSSFCCLNVTKFKSMENPETGYKLGVSKEPNSGQTTIEKTQFRVDFLYFRFLYRGILWWKIYGRSQKTSPMMILALEWVFIIFQRIWFIRPCDIKRTT